MPVRGSAWLDHAWGAGALGAGQAGWDWFALQLADGRDLMLYRLRRTDGSVDPASFGSLVGPDGAVRALAAGDVQVDELGHWTSPRGGPATPRAGAFGCRPQGSTSWWSRSWPTRNSTRGPLLGGGGAGAGDRGGTGYVELTGYADPPRREP